MVKSAACVFRFLVAIGSIFILSANAAVAASQKPVVVGYVAAFKGLDESIARTDLPAFTHLNLAFANPDPDGNFVRDETMVCMADAGGQPIPVAKLRETVRKLKAGGARVLISVGGGVIPGCSGDWKALLAPERRTQTAASLVALADTLGLDGLDVDLEGELLTAIDKAGNYTPFIADLSKAMRERGGLLTVATASYEGGMVPISSIPYFDFIHIMSYDAIGTSWGKPGSEHSPYAMAERDIDLWLKRGVAPEKLVLGVPFYGYSFMAAPDGLSYREIVEAHGAAARTDVVGLICPGCRYITFNSPDTIQAKAALASRKAGGVMVWELSQDTPDHQLTKAIKQGLGGSD